MKSFLVAAGLAALLATPAAAQAIPQLIYTGDIPEACITVKQHIDWILYQNMVYRDNFEVNLRAGLSPVESIIRAYQWSPSLDAQLVDCRPFAQDYLASQGYPTAG